MEQIQITECPRCKHHNRSLLKTENPVEVILCHGCGRTYSTGGRVLKVVPLITECRVGFVAYGADGKVTFQTESELLTPMEIARKAEELLKQTPAGIDKYVRLVMDVRLPQY